MQVVVQLGHVPGDETAIGGDGIPGQRCGLGLLDVGADVVEDELLGGGHVDCRLPHFLGEARPAVHLRDDLDHAVQRLVVGVDHHVDSLAEHVELGIGHQGSDLDQTVGPQVQPGHLTIDPHQFFTHSAQQYAHPGAGGPFHPSRGRQAK